MLSMVHKISIQNKLLRQFSPLVPIAILTADEAFAWWSAQSLQEVLDACLFEPGPWREDYSSECAAKVPAESRRHLSTPCGLLFNELQQSPAGVLRPLMEMIDLVLEFDTGKHTERNARLILVTPTPSPLKRG